MYSFMNKKSVVIMFISLFLLIISLSGPVSAADLMFNPGESIQAAVNNASAEDQIIMNDNRGLAHTNTEKLIMDKKLSLKTNNKVISYTRDKTRPQVSSTNPVGGAKNVPTNKVITVTFNENIKVGTNCFELKSAGGTTIPITSSIKGKVLTITPRNTLGKGVKYNLIIHTGSVKDISGNPVALCGFYFTTDNTAPKIISTNPFDGAKNIPTNKVINATFNENIKAGTNFIELKSKGGTSIPIKNLINGKTLTIKPNTPLGKGVNYNLIIHTGEVTDISGNPVALCGFHFTTDYAPTVTSSLAGGIYNTQKSVTLTASDNLDPNPVIYYSLNSGKTWNSKTKTVTLKLNEGVTILKFYARDASGNTCSNQTLNYIISQKQTTKALLNITAPNVLILGNYPFPTGLKISQQINLTDPVTWVSVVYRHVDEPGVGEIDIIVNGVTVLTKNFINEAFFYGYNQEYWWAQVQSPTFWVDLNTEGIIDYARRLDYQKFMVRIFITLLHFLR